MYATDMQALVRGSITPLASVETMSLDIDRALAALGVFSRPFCLDDRFPNLELFQELLLLLKHEKMPMFMLSINAKDQLFLGQRDDGRPLSIHDVWPFPLVSLVIDHPAFQLDALHELPENCVVTVVDENHLSFLEALDIAPCTKLFCPHGGPEAIPDPLATEKRPVDVLFIGNVTKTDPLDVWAESQAKGNVNRRKALKEAFEAVTTGEATLSGALEGAFGRYGLENTPRALCPFIRALLLFIHQRQRFEMLKAIRDCRVTVVGQIAPELADELAHHDLKGEMSFFYATSMMAKSKLLLNCCGVFPHGAHERVFYGLSRGAVVVTDNSAFLQEDFEQGLGMVALPPTGQELNELVSDLLASPDRIDRLRAQGLRTYPERHTWRERMGRILPAVKKHLEPHTAGFRFV